MIECTKCKQIKDEKEFSTWNGYRTKKCKQCVKEAIYTTPTKKQPNDQVLQKCRDEINKFFKKGMI